MNLESLRSLQKRIREATGADRELDALICAALRYAPGQSIDHYIYKFPLWRGRKDGRVEVVHESGDGGAHFCVPQLTLDPDGLGACVALMKQVLPGWRREVTEIYGGFDVRLFSPLFAPGVSDPPECHPLGDVIFEEGHALETHALLLAIVSAKIAEMETKQLEQASSDHKAVKD